MTIKHPFFMGLGRSDKLPSFLIVPAFVLVIACLYWVQASLIPVALSLLLTFVLTVPEKIGLERIPSVVLVVVLRHGAFRVDGNGVKTREIITPLDGKLLEENRMKIWPGKPGAAAVWRWRGYDLKGRSMVVFKAEPPQEEREIENAASDAAQAPAS